MRWTDMPADGGQADGRDRADHRRAEWEQLRNRLERLPPGHPSSPEHDGPDRAGQAPEQPGERDAQPEQAGERDAQPEQDGQREHDGQPGRGGPAVAGRDGGAAGDGRPSAGHRHQGPTGRHDPYQPWFTDGETARPWFADESG